MRNHARAVLLLNAMFLGAPVGLAQAQSSPGLVYGQVPTAANWNGYFAAKLDVNPASIAWSEAAAYAGAQMSAPYALMLNGASVLTEYQALHGNTHYATNGFAVAMSVPSSATNYEADGIYAYVNNSSTTTGGVAVAGSARPLANGTQTWAANFTVNDGGFQAAIAGIEVDVGGSNASSSAYGVAVFGGLSPSTPPGSNAAFFAQNIGGYRPWTTAFLSWDGAAQNALYAGASVAAANNDSQTVDFYARDNSNTPQLCGIQAVHQTAGANLNLTCAAGDIVAVSVLAAEAGGTSFISLGNIAVNGAIQAGSTITGTLENGAIGLYKVTATPNAPGAGYFKFVVEPGTTAGTAKLVVYAGTSATGVTLADNIGSGF